MARALNAYAQRFRSQSNIRHLGHAKWPPAGVIEEAIACSQGDIRNAILSLDLMLRRVAIAPNSSAKKEEDRGHLHHSLNSTRSLAPGLCSMLLAVKGVKFFHHIAKGRVIRIIEDDDDEDGGTLAKQGLHRLLCGKKFTFFSPLL